MFVFSVSSKKLRQYLIPSICIIAAAVVMFVFIPSGKKSVNTSLGGINYRASNAKERLAFISQFGWSVEEEPEEVREIVIPEEFDDVYLRHNELQKKQGLDLSKSRSKRVKRWTYIIKNYPGYSETDDCVRINLLVFDGCVIGGDVSSVELDGFMHTFAKEDAS